eukprot:m.104451 g.104451  ORF g.104451 m.104451 type:complete len:220 (+) comp8887_c0_seq3:40-699(+)
MALRRLAGAVFRQHGCPHVRAVPSSRSLGTAPPAAPVEDQEEHADEDRVRGVILAHALASVDEFGWTDSALAAGAIAAGYPVVSKGLFPRGPAHLVDAHMDACATALERRAGGDDFHGLAVNERLAVLLQERVHMLEPHKHSWQQALATLAQPSNLPHSLRTLGGFVHTACALAGCSVRAEHIALSPYLPFADCSPASIALVCALRHCCVGRVMDDGTA